MSCHLNYFTHNHYRIKEKLQPFIKTQHHFISKIAITYYKTNKICS